MAAPKVFISSTCYDLREVRDSLYGFVKSFGFDPVLSEYGDVFFHPDLHTHEACVNEVGNCHLFVLLIGGRFGGSYVVDKYKSVTNAEYDAAISSGIPVFTYIKKSVLDNHHLYQANKNNPHIGDIEFPAIEKKSDALNIFSFINRVRGASINNAYEGFETSRDIETHLRKQWASMFFDFLKNRDESKQISHTGEVVSNLKTTSDRLEALVKEIYRSVDREHANTKIEEIDRKSNAHEFFDISVSEFIPGYIILSKPDDLEIYASIDPNEMDWTQYLVALGVVEYSGVDEDGETNYLVPFERFNMEREVGANVGGFSIKKEGHYQFQKDGERLYKEGVCLLDKADRMEVILRYAKYMNEDK